MTSDYAENGMECLITSNIPPAMKQIYVVRPKTVKQQLKYLKLGMYSTG